MIKILPSGELSHLVVPENDYASDSEEEEEEEDEQRGGGVTAAADLSHLVVPDPDYYTHIMHTITRWWYDTPAAGDARPLRVECTASSTRKMSPLF